MAARGGEGECWSVFSKLNEFRTEAESAICTFVFARARFWLRILARSPFACFNRENAQK